MAVPGSKQQSKSATVEVDQRMCKACGLCIAFCPRKVLRKSTTVNDLGFRATEYTGKGCTGCGTCYDVCPEISVIRVYPPVRGAAAPAAKRKTVAPDGKAGA